MQNKRQEQLLAILSERRDWMTSRQLAGLGSRRAWLMIQNIDESACIHRLLASGR